MYPFSSQRNEQQQLLATYRPQVVLNHSGPMVEGTQYQLQCDIQNIAPLQNLVVKWYKGNEPLDHVTYSTVSKTPVDVSATLMISPSRDDDGAQYRCRAELDLGPEGPQPHPTVTSLISITVHCKFPLVLFSIIPFVFTVDHLV
jgi:hypothetical protein